MTVFCLLQLCKLCLNYAFFLANTSQSHPMLMAECRSAALISFRLLVQASESKFSIDPIAISVAIEVTLFSHVHVAICLAPAMGYARRGLG